MTQHHSWRRSRWRHRGPGPGQTQLATQRPTIVLVHGGFVTAPAGKVCSSVCGKTGNTVSIVQNPTTSLIDDVAATRQVIAASSGPVFWSVIRTVARLSRKRGTTEVVGLVYIAAFALDKGESVAKLIANPAPGAPVPPILPPQNGFLFLDKAKFAAAFAADVDAPLAEFMAQSQVPWGLTALNGEVTEASWRTKPSWYLVATDDHMIPPDAQRFMSKRAGATVQESPGSHAIYVSRPAPVVALIEQAARALETASR